MTAGLPLASTQATGLPEEAIAAIRQVLASHPEVEAAILYGSRALGRHRPTSDIDLTLIGPAISAAALLPEIEVAAATASCSPWSTAQAKPRLRFRSSGSCSRPAGISPASPPAGPASCFWPIATTSPIRPSPASPASKTMPWSASNPMPCARRAGCPPTPRVSHHLPDLHERALGGGPTLSSPLAVVKAALIFP
jgi:hypothetical protein